MISDCNWPFKDFNLGVSVLSYVAAIRAEAEYRRRCLGLTIHRGHRATSRQHYNVIRPLFRNCRAQQGRRTLARQKSPRGI
jgi:hypothetical protein